jgi:hypothetical protein
VELLNLCRKNLSDDGLMIFRTPNMDAPFASTFAYGDFTHEVRLNYSSALQLMLSAGFSNVEVKPSFINAGGAKELLRKLSWGIVKFFSKLTLFASGKSTRNVLLTPNLVIKANNSVAQNANS